MSPLKLIGGKFYRDGVEVPVKIGDSEQIELVRARERAIDKIEQEGAECAFCAEDICFDAICSFSCVCGANIVKSREEEISSDCSVCFEDYVMELFEDKEIQCRECKQCYVIENGNARMINKNSNR